MKSWKERPELFANGKFETKHLSKNYSIVGMSLNEEGQFYGYKLYDAGAAPFYCTLDESTLIARPISDMSDGEIFKLFEIAPIGHPDDFDEELEDEKDKDFVKENCKCLTDGFLYLLSIGVYPFDQSHFESGEVIARYENGEGE